MEVRDGGKVIGHMDVEYCGSPLRALRSTPLPKGIISTGDAVTFLVPYIEIPFKQWRNGPHRWWALDATGIDMTDVISFRPVK